MDIHDLPTCNGVSVLDEDLEKLTMLEKLADSKLPFNIRDVYSRSFLSCYVWRCREKLSVELMLEKLRDAVKVREEIHELERKMDKKYFHWLIVEQDLFASSGTQKGTDNNVFWIRSAACVKGMWKLQIGTPKACAFVRAWIYFYEMANVQAEHKPGKRVVYFCDPNGQGLLDFNVQLTVHLFGILNRLFFMDNECFVFFGKGKIVPVLMNQIKSLVGERMENIQFRSSDENPCDFLTSSSDMPARWVKEYKERKLRDVVGRPRSSEDRRNVWLFERVMTEDESERLTTADVYNAGPWPFEEFQPPPSPRLGESEDLDSFDSDDEDDW